MKTNIDDSGLYHLIQYLCNNAGLEANRTLRAKLREQNPKLAEAAKKAAEGDREVFGIPDAATLQRWLIEMGRPEIVVVEGQDEPKIVRPGHRPPPPQAGPEEPTPGPAEQEMPPQSWFDIFEEQE